MGIYINPFKLLRGILALSITLALDWLYSWIGISKKNEQVPRRDKQVKVSYITIRIKAPLSEATDQKDAIDQTASNLRSRLELIARDDSDLHKIIRTMNRFTVAKYNRREVYATVTFHTLINGPQLVKRIETAHEEHQFEYIYDHEFLGITPLYDPGEDASVDIIAVPGLNSHPFGSWKTKSPGHDDVWLRDYIPRDLPQARVLLYGYNSPLKTNNKLLSIMSLGETLTENINAFRRADSTDKRPVIFIGHSLGGLLVKQALLYSLNKPSNKSLLHDACYGMLFFGVPHSGLRYDQLMSIVKGQPNEDFIRELVTTQDSEPSSFLRSLAEQFATTCKYEYRTTNFYERVKSQTLEAGEDSDLRYSNNLCLLVTQQSATAVGLVSMAKTDYIALDLDHSGLIKYSRKEEHLYSTVRNRLKEFYQEACEVVPIRFAKHTKYPMKSEEAKACLDSLAFCEMETRFYDIKEAHSETCKWLAVHKTFVDWRDQSRGLLWIKGKPGSGKSTLLKHVIRELLDTPKEDVLVLHFFFHGRGSELQRTPLGLYRYLLYHILKGIPSARDRIIDKYLNRYKEQPWHEAELQELLKSSLKNVIKLSHVLLLVDALDECGKKTAITLVKFFQELQRVLQAQKSSRFRFGICFTCRKYPMLTLENDLEICVEEHNTNDINRYIQTRLFEEDLDYLAPTIIRHASGVFLWAQLVIDAARDDQYESVSSRGIQRRVQQIPRDLEEMYLKITEGITETLDALQLIRWVCYAQRPLSPDELRWAMAVVKDSTCSTLEQYKGSRSLMQEDKVRDRIKALTCGLVECLPNFLSQTENVQFIHQTVKDFFTKDGLAYLETKVALANELDRVPHYLQLRSCIRYLDIVGRQTAHDNDYEFCSRVGSNCSTFLLYATESWILHACDVEAQETEDVPEDYLMNLVSWPSNHICELVHRIYKYLPLPSSWRYIPVLRNDLHTVAHVASRFGLLRTLTAVTKDTHGRAEITNTCYGVTPLQVAVKSQQREAINILIGTGLGISQPVHKGRTAYHVSYGDPQTMELLLNAGNPDADFLFHLLCYLIRRPLKGDYLWQYSTRVVKMVIDSYLDKADPNSAADNSTTLMRIAVEMRKGPIVWHLQSRVPNIDFNKVDRYNRTPLFIACKHEYVGIIGILLGRKDINFNHQDRFGATPLSAAANRGHFMTCGALLDTGKVDTAANKLRYGTLQEIAGFVSGQGENKNGSKHANF
ncbi:hypothetical protein F4810DRAFT_711663 [Camillea tinctor]|nr:hypothetical protein F4810DRAFT_711663 [Camillea tinctor]